tara:strand:+ start:837 stop:1829 length:993 start_codon:yes stop_codon:yes gene_type:complete
MEERIESWKPHLLGFILPIVTIAGLLQGGWWSASGIIWGLIIGPILDLLSPEGTPSRKSEASSVPWNILLFGHSIAAVSALAALMYRAQLDGLIITTIVGAISVGLVSGISAIINAHEQGHRRKGSLIWRMGRLNLLWVMYMHFTTEHNHGHHRNYATELDPASSPKGRGLWTQIIKTIPLQFIAAWKTHSNKGRKGVKNPILHGLMIQISFVIGLYYGLGLDAVLAFLLSATVAIILLEFVNYLQHYGLRAVVGEKQTLAHSWESRKLWSRWTLLELPLHPAHHLKASDPMWNLRAQEGSPQLPFGYYVCFWLAVIPPLWKTVMDKRIP